MRSPDAASGSTLRALLVEDSENDALLLAEELRRGGYEPVCERVSTPEEMEVALAEAGARGEPWQVVLSDYYMPLFRAPDALTLLRRLGYDTPFIVVSGKIGEDAAVAMMQAGAQDYVTKENLARLCPAIERELREAAVRQERQKAEEALNRSREAQRLLAEAGAVLSSALDYQVTLESLARLVVPRLADWCAVDVVAEDGGTHRLAVEHQNPEKVRLAHELQRRYPPDPDARRGTPQVLRSGRSEFYPEITEEIIEAAARDEEHLRLLREMAFTSLIIVPLVARGKTLGAITLVSAESGRRFGEADLRVAEELARRAALAMDNAKLYEGAQKEIAERRKAEEELRKSEERYRTFVEQSTEGIWRVEFEQPIPIDGAEDEQIDLFYGHGYLAECNDTMAQMYGYGRAEEILGAPFDDLLPRSVPENIEYLRSAIRSGYRLTDAESQETDKEGNAKYFLNNLSGIVEDGFLMRAWGTQRDITERKRAEEALKESEERFRATFHQAAVGVAHLGLDGRWLRVNERLSEIVGYPREELLNKTFQDITHPEDLEKDLGYVRRLLAGEIETYSIEKRYFKKDGSIVWINLTGSLVRDAGGEPAYFIAVIEDISERKDTEEALRQSETRYRTLVEQIPAITYIEALDRTEEPEWYMLYVSPQVEKLLGYAPQEWLAIPDLWSRILHPEDRERVLAEDARTERTGEMFSSEHRLLARDGTIVWIRDEAVLVRDEAGEPLFWQGIMFDITGSKLAEEALLQSEERYRAVVEQSTEGIYLLDAETKRILEANPALVQMLGYEDEELLGMEVYDLIAHPREDVDSNLGRTLKEGRRFVGERRYRHKDGGLVVVEVGVSVIRYGGRKVVCAVVRDITERKRAEETLREVREAERNRIARDLHDDILQDIVYALQEIQIMQVTSENGADAALEDTAEALRRSVEGLRGAIFELRLKEGLGQSFVSSLETLVDLNRRMARNRYELQLDVEDGFPPALSEKAGQELTRIIQEALTNARRHSEARRVGVRLWLAGDLACAEVADDGRGFDAAQTGIGVGQHSMRHRALELGGDLQVESEPGRGTRVRFYAPLSRLIET